MFTARTSRTLCRRGRPAIPSSSSLPPIRQRCGNRSGSFSHLASIARRQEHKTQYYVATLPWAVKEGDRKERFDDLVKNAKLTENDQIVASSITTSKRASPIASSLKSEIEDIVSTTNKTGGGAWLLIKANNETQASDILKELKMNQVFDMDKSTIEAVHLEKETGAGGPLYDDNSDSNSSNMNSSSTSNSTGSSSSSPPSHDGIAREKENDGDAPDTVFRDITGGKSESSSSGSDNKAQKSSQVASPQVESASTGGHSVETNGPLYGK